MNKIASELAHLRWDRLSAEQRAAAVPRNRRRKYPRCPRYGSHRFTRHRCPCGYTPLKEAFRGLVARYGLHWGADVPKSALELLEEIARVLTDEEKRELFISMGLRWPPQSRS